MAELVSVDLLLLVGTYAQRWALEDARRHSLTDTVRAGPRPLPGPTSARAIPLPHPSWRNTGWIKANPWFEAEILPGLRAAIAQRL
jgi:uracil-DNA glycosylase